MTISEAISMVDRLKPNQYTESQKIMWLSQLDGKIFLELVSTHADGAESFEGYTDETDNDTKLLVDEPYSDDIYNYYLQSMIDRENGEIAKYNQSGTLFNASYLAYANYYNRMHLPLPHGSYFKF